MTTPAPREGLSAEPLEEWMTLRPLDAANLDIVTRRHSPHERDGYVYCTRCFEEFWPCDAARLLATLGEAFVQGALSEYRIAKATR